MIKTIVIDGKEVQFKASASFPLVYKANFNADILTVIMPLISELLDGMDDILKESVKKDGNIELKPSTLSGLLQNVYSLELIDIMNLLWTLAKCADDTIPEPMKWFNQFDEFPVFDIAVEVFPMLFESLFSKKKLKEIAKVATVKNK
ncbi:hypothetical protein [Peptoniphilus sp. BV3C26]|uniref:hypothetical protein n=1 Tax=Peptoniphilus sp. BV3C26 TaxID=1111134 RepID=UPI0003B8D778|nr:hypothetical protein [Peptoniphilus sp. BV3C26]ERT57743.1 hypothetical protein HMPREF1253_0376 [Peptoniphilus sp. BV3C26]